MLRLAARRWHPGSGSSYHHEALSATGRARSFTVFSCNRSDLQVRLTAPNGRDYNQPTGLFIENEFVKSMSGSKITSIDPADESEITSVYAADVNDVDAAVTAARTAFKHPSWRDLSPSSRGELMRKLAGLVEEHAETLATIETWDNGKPYRAALEEDVVEVVRTLRYYAGWADKISGQVIDVSSTKLAYTVREPIGVCGQIIPWNYPLSTAAWKLGPSLACGNTVVLKAAEQTPLSILYLASLVQQAGFPPGVVNVLNGTGRTAGAAIASHLGVDKLSFTGSTATGRHVMKLAAINLKNVTLETGGKSALLVFEDADMASAVEWAHTGAMSNQGQMCSATSRILVQESVHGEFVKLFKARVAAVSKVGDPFEASTFQGPQVSRAQYERILSYIEGGLSEGAKLACGGMPSSIGAGTSRGREKGKGFFIEPTVFTHVTQGMAIEREEIFGPVATISSFSSESEALARANDGTIYGLAASVFTRDVARAHRLAGALEAGTVWINSSNDGGDPRVPFGGVKQSGVGRELGEAGLAAYSNTKAVTVNTKASR